jgi:hypothetical protein
VGTFVGWLDGLAEGEEEGLIDGAKPPAAALEHEPKRCVANVPKEAVAEKLPASPPIRVTSSPYSTWYPLMAPGDES